MCVCAESGALPDNLRMGSLRTVWRDPARWTFPQQSPTNEVVIESEIDGGNVVTMKTPYDVEYGWACVITRVSD